MRRTAAAAVLLGVAGACAAVPDPVASPGSETAAGRGPAGGEVGGSLRTDQVTLELRDGVVSVRVTPLDAEVVTLTAPDARRRLEAIAAAHRPAPDLGGALAADAAMFLVTFLSTEDGASFDPGAIVVEVGGQRLHPTRIAPLTPGWGEQRLRPLTPEQAVYVFGRPVSVLIPFTVHLGTRASARWDAVIPLLRAEEGRRF